MKKRMLVSAGRLATLVVAGILLAAVCLAAEFSADIVTKDGKNVSTSKIYVADQKLRRESTVGGQESVTIIRADKNVTWQLNPKDKSYVEMKSAKLMTPDPVDLKKFADEKQIGREKVAGYWCKEYLYTPRDEGGANITVWMSEELNWPLKVKVVHVGGSMTSEYRNIKREKPKDLLFEVPYFYKKITPEEPKTVAPTRTIKKTDDKKADDKKADDKKADEKKAGDQQ